MRIGSGAIALAFAALLATAAGGQEIREIDLGRDDGANVARMLAEATDDLTAGKTDAALARVASILAICGQDPAPELRPLAAQALLLRARLRLADNALALADVDAALQLEPTLSAAAGDPRRLREIVDQARRRLLGHLTVTSEPSGAVVKVDGVSIGTTPLRAVPVIAATHYVRVTRVGYAVADLEARVAPGKLVELHAPLVRRGSTLLLLTNADHATIRWLDGTLLGVAARPAPDTAHELVSLFNLPIDPYEPSPMLLVQDAPPGRHDIVVEAPCHHPRQQVVDVPEGADSTTMISLVPAVGRLTLRGSPDLRIRLDGGDESTLPRIVSALCPGHHLIEAVATGGERTRRSVWIDADQEMTIEIELLPVLAWLGGDDPLAHDLATLKHMNLARVEGLSAIDHASLIEPLDREALHRIDAILTANQAVMCAWSEGDGEDRTVHLLAKGSPISDRVALGPASESPDLIALINQDPQPPTLAIGLTAIDTGLFSHPLVAALSEGGSAQRAGVRVGDAITHVDGVVITSAAELEASVQRAGIAAAMELSLSRPAGDAVVSLTSEFLVDDTTRFEGMPANLVIARTLAELTRSSAEPSLPALRLRMGRAYLSLGAWSQAVQNLSAASVDELPLAMRGNVLFDLGWAASKTPDHDLARAAWNSCLRYPEARAIAADGPPITTIVPELLRRLAPPREK